jgi:hypothetical protein
MPHARALKALEELKAGNRRFLSNEEGRVAATIEAAHRMELAAGQSPQAIVPGLGGAAPARSASQGPRPMTNSRPSFCV